MKNTNISKTKRLTKPKQRGIIERYKLQRSLAKNEFDNIEYMYKNGLISIRELEKSKKSKNRKKEKLYKEVQEYEDAIEDVSAKKAYTRFKIGLGTVLLAGTLAVGNFVHNQATEIMSNIQSNSTENDKKNEENNKLKIGEIQNQIKQRDGYKFNYLSQQELKKAYKKIISIEIKMHKNEFRGAFFDSKDQEILDKIVKKAYGEEYNKFSTDQKRDLKQLSFELLYIALPEIFEEDNDYVRNPIVIDALNARDIALSKGYEISIEVNNSKTKTLKNIGSILTLSIEDCNEIIEVEDNEQNVLEKIVKEVLKSDYENFTETEKRDYMQFAYEFLSEKLKNVSIKDPIETEEMINKTNDNEKGNDNERI